MAVSEVGLGITAVTVISTNLTLVKLVSIRRQVTRQSQSTEVDSSREGKDENKHQDSRSDHLNLKRVRLVISAMSRAEEAEVSVRIEQRGTWLFFESSHLPFLSRGNSDYGYFPIFYREGEIQIMFFDLGFCRGRGKVKVEVELGSMYLYSLIDI